MAQWFKKHPDFLRKESTALSSNSNYKELFQVRENLFISHGNIIVRLDKVYRFPILIIYTDATPYQLPLIYPLKKDLTKEEIDTLASLQLKDAIEKIKPEVLFYYDLRHQNGSGSLCIIEWDNLDSGSAFYAITEVLKRVKEWCNGHITGDYPEDSQEVEFCSHFNNINPEIKWLYPESFLNDRIFEGDFYACLYNHIPKTSFYTYNRYFYIGVFIDGIAINGLVVPINTDLSSFQIPNIKNYFDLLKKPELIKEQIENKNLLKGQWFHIDKEPQPFKDFKELVSIIGNGEFNTGVTRLYARSYDSLKFLPQTFIIGIRFPNKKGNMEFQSFLIYKKDQPPGIIISADASEKMRSVTEQFDKVEAIEGEKLTPETYHERNSLRADFSILKNSCVSILGVGAIGSEIADCIAKAGVGRILLFDNQVLKAHNCVRHFSGLQHVGEAKVISMAYNIAQHNPFVNVTTAIWNLYNLSTAELPDDSLYISSVADDNLEAYINECQVISHRTTFYVRALRGGKVVRMFRVIPGKDACFQCLNLYRKDKSQFVDIPEDKEFPTIKNECNNPIRPASAADLKLAASLGARFLIDHIQKGAIEHNHWIWSSEKIDGTPIQIPYQIHSQHIPIHPQCYYCNHPEKLSVSITEEAVSFMQTLIKKDNRIETGGVLAGYTDTIGNIHITIASEPGPKAIRSATKFEKDVQYCQNFLDQLYLNSNQKTVYLGEWHSHPSVNNKPSGMDIKSLTEIAIQKEYLTEMPVMIIFSNNGNPSCTIHPAGKLYYEVSLNIIK